MTHVHNAYGRSFLFSVAGHSHSRVLIFVFAWPTIACFNQWPYTEYIQSSKVLRKS